MDFDQEYFRLKRVSEGLWSQYLELATRDWDDLILELEAGADVLERAGMKKASAALIVLITKTNLDINEKNRGI